jgi:hypothetical protein
MNHSLAFRLNRIIRWLEKITSRPKAQIATDQPAKPLTVEDVAMPDIYADEHLAKVPKRETLVPASPEADEKSGFNPYDTAVFQKK